MPPAAGSPGVLRSLLPGKLGHGPHTGPGIKATLLLRESGPLPSLPGLARRTSPYRPGRGRGPRGSAPRKKPCSPADGRECLPSLLWARCPGSLCFLLPRSRRKNKEWGQNTWASHLSCARSLPGFLTLSSSTPPNPEVRTLRMRSQTGGWGCPGHTAPWRTGLKVVPRPLRSEGRPTPTPTGAASPGGGFGAVCVCVPHTWRGVSRRDLSRAGIPTGNQPPGSPGGSQLLPDQLSGGAAVRGPPLASPRVLAWADVTECRPWLAWSTRSALRMDLLAFSLESSSPGQMGETPLSKFSPLTANIF